MSNAFRLSVAIPVYNEESVLPELLRRLGAVLDQIQGGPHEMVFVDDGSSDSTFRLLEKAAAADTRIIAISLSRNFGQQAALSAALDIVTGDAVILMESFWETHDDDNIRRAWQEAMTDLGSYFVQHRQPNSPA